MMTEITIHLDAGAHPIDIHFDGGQGTPIAAFVLLTAVPVEPMASHIICFGNSDTVGRLIVSMWRNSVEKDPDGAWVIEQAARDIIDAADSHRKRGRGRTSRGTLRLTVLFPWGPRIHPFDARFLPEFKMVDFAKV